jgi:hypothetical protein
MGGRDGTRTHVVNFRSTGVRAPPTRRSGHTSPHGSIPDSSALRSVICGDFMPCVVGPGRIELPTIGLRVRCSTELSYRPTTQGMKKTTKNPATIVAGFRTLSIRRLSHFQCGTLGLSFARFVLHGLSPVALIGMPRARITFTGCRCQHPSA